MKQISISRDGVWAGDGRIDGDGEIVDCPAVLGADPDASDAAYEAIQEAIESGEDEVTRPDGTYTWTITEEEDEEVLLHQFCSHVSGLEQPFLGEPADCGYRQLAQTVAVLTRQWVRRPNCFEQVIIGGERAEPDGFAQDMGVVTGAWWEVPLPPCPDCCGALMLDEADHVSGTRTSTRTCTACGSLFSINTERRTTDVWTDHNGNTGTMRSFPLDVARADHRAALLAAYSGDDERIEDLEHFRKWLTSLGLNHYQVAEVVDSLPIRG